MNRVRRLAAAAFLMLAVTASGVAVAPSASADEWFCAAARAANRGICVGNPLPDRLPLP